MGCQSSYSCPIVIPTGTAGSTGAAGADGTDGAAVYINTTGTTYTSNTPGDQLLTSQNLTAGASVTGDVIDIEALYSLASFVGTIYTQFGGSTIASHILASGVGSGPVLSGATFVKLKTRIFVTATSAQYYSSTVEVFGNPTWVGNVSPSTLSVNTAAIIAVASKATITSGTASLKSLTVIVSKKV